MSEEKSEFASQHMIFLGILLDRKNHVLAVPNEKREKALKILRCFVERRKIKIKEIQKLTGILNFLQRAIISGRTFNHSLYDKLKIRDNKGELLKQYHHVQIHPDVKMDCAVWIQFLEMGDSFQFCRPFIDINAFQYAHMLKFFTDASLNRKLGFGAVFNNSWMYGRWGKNFIESQSPSIEYLELFATCAGILMWGHRLTNTRIIIFCDNQAIMFMINNMTSKCSKCMKLIRMIQFNCLLYNRRIFVRFIRLNDNGMADALSRMDFNRFWSLAPPTMILYPDAIPDEIWPIEKIWFN